MSRSPQSDEERNGRDEKPKKRYDDEDDEDDDRKSKKKSKKYDDESDDERDRKKKKKSKRDYSDESDDDRKSKKKSKRYDDESDDERDRKKKKKSRRDHSDDSDDSYYARKKSRKRDRRRDYSDDSDDDRDRRRDRDRRDRDRGGDRDRRDRGGDRWRDDRDDYDDRDFSRAVERRYPGFTQHEFSRVQGNTGRTNLDKVERILAQRIEAKRANDFPVADRLRDQLRRELGVEVMDRERLWWSVNGERGQMPTFKASSHDYKRTDDLPDVDIEPINQILAQRLQARITRDFATADQLRVDLRRMGVEVDDKARTFTCVSSGGGGGGRRRNDDDDYDAPRNGRGGDDYARDERGRGRDDDDEYVVAGGDRGGDAPERDRDD